MKILLIEDDEEKAGKLEEALSLQFSNVSFVRARSLNSGLRALISEFKSIDLLLLDMSMTSYDATDQDPTGGVPEPFAGKEILAQMQLRAIYVPTIVVTMFDSFCEGAKKVSLDQLTEELKERFEPIFRGVVYYNSRQEGWRSALVKLVQQSLGKNS